MSKKEDSKETLAKPNMKERRKCLKCRRKFPSNHATNRICEPCGRLNGAFDDKAEGIMS